MSSDVFVSYSQQDKAAAEEICRILEAGGVTCWIAPRDIPPGATWANAIVQAIQNCKAMILVCSENSNQSRQMSRELQLADEKHVPIIPARLSNVQLAGEYSYYLNNTQWLDLFPGSIEDRAPQVHAAVRGAMGMPRAAVPVASTRPPAAARNPKPIYLAGGVVVAILAGAGTWMSLPVRSTPPSDPSKTEVVTPAPPPEDPAYKRNTKKRPVTTPVTNDPEPQKSPAGEPATPAEVSVATKDPGPVPPSDKIPYVLVPRHRQFPEGFWMAVGPVTVGQFSGFAKRMPKPPESNPGWKDTNAPMVNVRKEQAIQFCQWVGGSLPTSDEMRYAARTVDLIGSSTVSEMQRGTNVVQVSGRSILEKSLNDVTPEERGFRCLSRANLP